VERIIQISCSKDEIVLPRYQVYFFAHYKFKIGIKKIQRFFGHAQHGTIINGLNRMRGYLESYKPVKEAIKAMESQMDRIPVRIANSRQLAIKEEGIG
jgi:chromosomal replication initiation ATPase DnaA